MNNRLSHSQLSKYQSCGKEYEYHYIKRIRPTRTKAYFPFGSAFDKASEMLVKSRSLDAAKQVFTDHWTKQEINGQMVELEHYDGLVYSKYDYDADFLSGDQQTDNLDVLSWRCLHVKGHVMLEALHRDILPRLGEVLSTQEEINLRNEDGDEVVGYSDIVAVFDNVPTVLDIKTSSIDYDEDAVLVSQQLSLYVHSLFDKYQTRKAGFIVISKRINKNKKKKCTKCGVDGSGTSHKTCSNTVDGKRCHGEFAVTMSFSTTAKAIIDDIPEQTEHIVLENVDVINKAIKQQIFPRNLNNCKGKYGTCLYYNLCYKNEMTDLVDLGEKHVVKAE